MSSILLSVIKKAFLRSVCTEYYKAPCTVYAVNKLEDKIRASSVISKYELKCNLNRRNFIQHMTSPECNSKIDNIYFDNFRIIPTYVADNFGKDFLERLKEMTKQNILSDFGCNGKSH